MPTVTRILDARAMARVLQRVATEIVERSQGADDLLLIGIQRRGGDLGPRRARGSGGRQGTRAGRRGCRGLGARWMSPAPSAAPLGKDLIGLEYLTADQIRLILDTAEPFKEVSERSIKKVPALR